MSEATVTLKYRLDDASVVSDLNQITSAAAKTDVATKNLSATAQRASLDFKSMHASLADFARAGASASQIVQLTGTSLTNATKAVREYSGSLAKGEYDTRGLRAAQEQLALAGLKAGEAFKQNTNALNLHVGAGASATKGLNSVRAATTSLAASALNAAPGVTQLGAAIGVMGLGAPATIAVLAGVAAIGFSYDELTKKSREAAKVQDEAIKSLKQLADVTAHGPGGQMAIDLENARKGVERLQKQIDQPGFLQKLTDLISGSAAGGFAGAGVLDAILQATGAKTSVQNAGSLGAANTAVSAGQQRIIETVQQATVTEAVLRKEIARRRELADTLINEQLKRDLLNNSYDLQIKLLENSVNLTGVQRAQADASAKALKGLSDEQARYNDNLRKHEITQQALADLEQYRRTIDKLGLSLTELSRIPVSVTSAGSGKFSLLPGGSTPLTSPEREAIETRNKAAEYLKSRQRESLDLANLATRKAQEHAQLILQTAGGAADFARAMGLADQRTADLVRNIASAAGGIALLQNAVNRKNDGTGSTAGVLLASLPVIGAASSIGAASPSAAGAGIGGAAAGAAAGAAIGSVVPILGTAIGAVVGGIGGMAAGLLGHASKIKEVRREFDKNQAEYIASLAVFPSSLAQQFAGIGKAFTDLETVAKAIGKSVSSEARSARDAAQARIQSEFTASIGEQFNALAGPAGEYANAQNTVTRRYIEQRDTAIALGRSQEELNAIQALYIGQLGQLRNELEKAATSPLLDRFRSLTGATAPTQSGLKPFLGDSEYLRPLFDTFTAYLDKIEATKKAAEVSAYYDQIAVQIAQQQLQTAQETQRVQEATVSGLSQTLDALRRTSASLALGALSPLNARQRYGIAENELEAQFRTALGGGPNGQKAAQGIGSFIDSFLGISKERFASGTPYASDYNRAQSMLDALEGIYGTQLTTEEKALAELKKHTALLEKANTTGENTLVQQLVQRATDRGNEANRIAAILHGMGYQLTQDVTYGPGGANPTGQYYATPGYTPPQQGTPSYQARWDAYVAAHGGNPDLTTSEWIAAGMPAYARGTSWHRGGVAMVGERGPELVRMPTGSSVTNSDQFAAPIVAEQRALRQEFAALRHAFADQTAELRRAINARNN